MSKKNNEKNDTFKPQVDSKDKDSLDNLPREVQLLINELEITEPQKEKVVKAIIAVSTRVMSRSYSGPLPPPDVLEGYNHSVKDGAERIVRMAEPSHEKNFDTHADD